MNHGMILGCLQAHPGWQGQGKDNNWISLKRSAGSHKIASFMRKEGWDIDCLLYTSPSPRDKRQCRMPSSA